MLSALRKQPQIDAVTASVETSLASIVVRIRSEIKTDWSGDWSVYFRIVLKDKATRGKNLERATTAVREALLEGLRPLDLDLLTYFHFRSESEQSQLHEPSWA